MAYRPWGPLDWALKLSTPRQWSFLGSLGTEERSLAAWRWMSELNAISQTRLLEIYDMPSRHTARAQQLLSDRIQAFLAAGGNMTSIHRGLGLMTELHRIVALGRDIESPNGGCAPRSVLLDITSLPKRYFFPLLRLFHQSKSIRDLVITYTSASTYIEGDYLSEDATDWLTMAGFHGNGSTKEMLIVSVGFMVESLQNHVGTITKHESVKMLIPFPAPLSILRRTWDSLYCLESTRSPEKFDNHRVDTTDLPNAFDRIVSLARESSATPAFAPLGPKTISAAMCLFASKWNCAVYYPQPRIYHPDYSRGVGRVEGKPAVNAYWIKHDGQSLYS